MSEDRTASRARGLTSRMMVALTASLIIISGLLVAMIINLTSTPKAVTKYPITTFVASSTLQVGASIPNTPALRRLIGAGSESLGAAARHRPMVINFFASYCTACAQEMRTFAQVSSADRKVQFVGIDTNEPDLAKARSLVTGAKIAYPVLVDNAESVMLNSFGISNLPTTFFIAASGRIVEEVLGVESPTQLRANLARL